MNDAVYVCGFFDYDEEDIMHPLAVFTEEKDAISWCEKVKGIGPDNYYYAAYKSFTLNKSFSIYDNQIKHINTPFFE